MEPVLLILVVLVAIGIVLQWGKLFNRARPSDAAPAADDSEAYDAVLEYGHEVAVAGESYSNDDGTPRREIIALLSEGDPVKLVRDPKNKHDAKAVIVRSEHGVIGYVSREDEGQVADWLDEGEPVMAYITAIAGGPENGKPEYGVWLHAAPLDEILGLK